MFTDWQNQVLEMKFPFDVQVNSQNPEYDFARNWILSEKKPV